MKTVTRQFENTELQHQALAESFRESVNDANSRKEKIHIVLPGGSTPMKFFNYLSDPLGPEINWQAVHLYWGDERCVPPDHADSNYGMTAATLLDHIDIPGSHIHRIRGENSAEDEVFRYSEEIKKNVPQNKPGLPQFDWIILGLGTDGHTASLFPHMTPFSFTGSICIIANHPTTGQKRISLNLAVLNNAKRITFLVSGASKASIVSSILKGTASTRRLPAALVLQQNGKTEWYLDRAAAKLL
jgi:6-phosphogluconolactonase